MKKQTFHLLAAAIIAVPVALTSCTEEDSVPALKILSMGVSSENVIQLNDTLNIAPQLSSTDGVTYLWTLDGDSVGASASYSFVAKTLGSFQLSLTAVNITGVATQTVKIQVRKGAGGFYVINEGAYPQPASFNYYTDSWAFNSFDDFSAQTNYTFGVTGTMAAVGTDALYMVTKDAPVLTRIGLEGWKVETVIDSRDLIGGGQGQAICLVSDNKAVFTTTRGAYVVDLGQKAIVDTLTSQNATDVVVNGDYMYLLVSDSVNIYKKNDLSLVDRAVAPAKTGFAITEAGDVWAADDTALVRFEASRPTEPEVVALPSGCSVYYNMWAYTPSSLKAVKGKNALYFSQPSGYSANAVYEYDIDGGQISKIFELEGGSGFYGSGIHVDPKSGNLYLVSTVNYKSFLIDVVSPEGNKQEEIVYGNDSTVWFPSTIIFE